MQDAERALAMKGMQVIDRNIEVEGIRVASAASGKSDQPYGGLQLHQMAQVRYKARCIPCSHRGMEQPPLGGAACSAGAGLSLPQGPGQRLLRRTVMLDPLVCLPMTALSCAPCWCTHCARRHSTVPGKEWLASMLRSPLRVCRCSLLSCSSSPWQHRWHRCVLRPSSTREPMWAKVNALPWPVSTRALLRL